MDREADSREPMDGKPERADPPGTSPGIWRGDDVSPKQPTCSSCPPRD